MKMRSRLLLTAIVLLSLGFYLLVEWIVNDVRLHYFITMEESLVDTSVILAEQLSYNLATDAEFRDAFAAASDRVLSAAIYNHVKTNMNLRVIIVDHKAQVIFDSRGALGQGGVLNWRDVKRALQGEYGARSTYELKGDPDSFHFYVAAPVMKDGKIIGAVSVGKPVSSIYPFMKQAKARLMVSGMVAFGAILLLLLPVSLWIIQPVRALTGYARDIRDGRKVIRPKLGHGGEMSELANAFEEMRDALEGKQYVEQYVQALTHEMKSPLAAIQGAAELLNEEMPAGQRKKFLANISAESERLHGLVDRMLSLAAIEKRKELEHPEPVYVQVLLEDVVDSLLPVARSKGVKIQCHVDRESKVQGEYFLLRQALANLVQNAIDFSPRDGVVEIHANGSEVVVSDSGCGIPDYALSRVFERFYSLPRPESGLKSSGLGLNFVREIARLHGGDAELINRPEGGVEARLTLN